jgi:signal transduction histidine kinase
MNEATSVIHVLYVSDKPEMPSDGKTVPGTSGDITIDTVPSAQLAMEMMTTGGYDAIVSDFSVPETDGIAFLKQVRSHSDTVAFILVTGKGHEESVINALNSGADFSVWDDGDPESRSTELQQKIRSAVRKRMKGPGLSRKNEELEEENRKNVLMNNILRHDIANLLTVLRGRLKIARKEARDPHLILHLDKMEDAGKEIFNRLETARSYLEIGIHVQECYSLESVLDQAYSRFLTSGIRLYRDVHGLSVFTDPHFPLVFANLLDNTVRHGMHATTIRVTYTITGQELTVFWEDDGVGIAAEEKELIFMQGFGKNTGLGLFITREILSTTGITITETGIPGKGARFELHVPKEKFLLRSDG